jgi:hypothetical protein
VFECRKKIDKIILEVERVQFLQIIIENNDTVKFTEFCSLIQGFELKIRL